VKKKQRWLAFFSVIMASVPFFLCAEIISLYNEHEYNAFVQENTHQPIVIQYAASWCNVCTNVSPLISTITQDPEFKDNVIFARIDVDTVPALCKAHNIQAIPTFSYLHKGRLIKQITGIKNIEDFDRDFKHNLRTTFRLASNDNTSLTQIFRDFFQSSGQQKDEASGEQQPSFFSSWWANICAWYENFVEKIKALWAPAQGIQQL